MAAERYLIVNADDFGLSPGVNRGIIEAHEQGIVTSASLMVRWPAAAAAAAYYRGRQRISLGLHVDLGEWVYRDGDWVPLYEVIAQDDTAAVADEVSRQLAEFRRLLGRNPTHLDSHQHVHRSEPVRSILLVMARTLGLPLRHLTPEISYCGSFYGQTGKGEAYHEGISVAALIEVLTTLPPGITELGCHPGLGDDYDSVYCRERAAEVQALCHPEVRAALATEGIELCSFHDVAGLTNGVFST